MQQNLDSVWPLDPQVVFLNHGSYGSCPRPVLEAQNRLREQMEARPVEFLGRQLETRLDQVREELAEFVQCSADRLAFVPNATYGVNSVLRSLNLEPGDEILVTDHEYNACRNVVDYVAKRSQAKVVVVDLPFPLHHSETVVDRLLAAVTSHTRILLLDYVTSATGLVLPLLELVPKLRDFGVRILVDGAHTPGLLDLDLRHLHADYFTGNCHKWMNTPKGAAFLYVRPELQDEVRPACISHGANANRSDRSRFLTEFDWTGTMDPTAILCIPAAIHFVEELVEGGWPELRRRNRKLALEARALVLQALGMPAPAPDSMIASMVAFPLSPEPTQEPTPSGLDPLQAALREQFNIEIPVSTWGRNAAGHPHRTIRFSVQHYNTLDQYQLLADALLNLGASALVAN
jgi:isopenicillin-N epimerase